MPSSRARTNSLEIAFDDYLIKNASAKGKRVSNRVVRRVSSSTGIRQEQAKQNLPLPGLDRLQADDGKEEISLQTDQGGESNN